MKKVEASRLRGNYPKRSSLESVMAMYNIGASCCFVTDFAAYRIGDKLAVLLETKERLSRRIKLYKKIQDLERLICQIDGELYAHGMSLNDLSFKALGQK